MYYTVWYLDDVGIKCLFGPSDMAISEREAETIAQDLQILTGYLAWADWE